VNNVIGCRSLSRELVFTRSNKVTRVHDFTKSVLLPKHYHYFCLSGTVGFYLFLLFLFCICICISIVFCLSGEINIYYFISLCLLLLLYYVSATMSWWNKDYQKHISYSARETCFILSKVTLYNSNSRTELLYKHLAGHGHAAKSTFFGDYFFLRFSRHFINTHYSNNS